MAAEAAANYWRGDGADTWTRMQAQLDALTAPITDALLERADLKPGYRVLDVGCGAGGPTIVMAARVAPGGRVCGIDISGPMLEQARARVTPPEVAVEFFEGDAQTFAFLADFDRIVSQVGVMFFADPAAAFSNLRGAGRAGARIAWVCWRPLVENTWLLTPLSAAFQSLPPRDTARGPQAPNPYSLAEEGRLLGLLATAGFRDIAVSPLDVSIRAASVSDYIDTLSQLYPLKGALDGRPPGEVAVAREAMAQALEPFTDERGLNLPAACWVAEARC